LELLKGLDAAKDQSYFLHRLSQAQLGHTVFPLGALAKTEVRRLAAEIGLPNAKKKDSTGICFIGERPFRAFLNRYLANTPGAIEDDRGRTVGEHVGLSFYTIGQRKGIGIGGKKDATADAWYVAEKRMASNELVVVQGHDHPLLMKSSLRAQDASWIAGSAPVEESFSGKTRYRQADAECRLEKREKSIAVEFSRPQWAVTPGQSVVLYDREVCLGGGVIT
jgi:tRNA-specific 2-thiouridylase